MVFYRKYRPQTLDGLTGQENVKKALGAAISTGKLAHAYLFCGPRGTGKTSTARILAKIVNCKNQSSVISRQPSDGLKADSAAILKTESLPCNKCSSCISITEGSNLDVTEMDAASNRGIDDIRSLRENIKLAPVSSRKKVYIIDEVHMLSGDAFNALLKTLEEPPAHVLFVLATTEVQKIPQTILSRVSRLDFKPATTADLVATLSRIAKEEKIEISEGALAALAKKANGSFRDGVKFLDQVSSMEKVDLAAVERNLGLESFENISGVLQSIAESKSGEALEKILQLVESGANIKELTLSVLDLLRQLLYLRSNLGPRLVKPEMEEEKYQVLAKLAEKFDQARLLGALRSFQGSLEQSRFVTIPSLPLEIAVVESCGKNVKEKLDVRGEKIDEEAGGLKLEDSNTDQTFNIQHPTSNDDLQKLSDRWTYILETVRQYNYSLEALLRLVKLSQSGENGIVVEVPYSFHQRILEAPKSRDLLESVFADILGRPIKVSTVLGQKPVRKEDVANVEVAADDEIVRLASEIFSSDQVN